MENRSVGLTLCDVLGVVFIVLKLCNVIDWSWWWVLAPIWMPTVLCLLVLLIIAAFR